MSIQTRSCAIALLSFAPLCSAETSPASVAIAPVVRPQQGVPTHVHGDALAARGNGVLRGRVVDGIRGGPIAQASVTVLLRRVHAQSAAQLAPVYGSFTARTQADGTFVLTLLPAGVYSVTADKSGYYAPPSRDPVRPRSSGPPMRASAGVRTLTLGEGASVTVPDLVLVRGGVLTGRVVDEHGEPVIRAQVIPIQRSGVRSQPFRSLGRHAVTDDRGRYRAFGLPPGQYTVQVAPRGSRQMGGVIQGDRREPLPAFATGVTEISGAEFVEVTYGTESTLDARLPSGHRVLVAGRVLPDDTASLAEVSITLRSADPQAQVTFGGARADREGRFVVQDVAPGRYLLVAEELVPLRGAPGLLQEGRRAGWTEVQVGDADLADVALSIGHGATIQGRIEIDGAGAEAVAGRPVRVSAVRPRHHPVPRRSVEGEVGPDLTFTIPGVPGPHSLQVVGLPEGWWVKAMSVAGRDALGGHDFPHRGIVDDVVLLVSARPTGVTGRVHAAVPVEDVFVIAVPEDDAVMDAFEPSGGVLRPVQADGTFAVRGLRPGRYFLAALTMEAMEARRDETLEGQAEYVRSVGVIVDVGEGRLPSVVLRLADAAP